MPTRRGENTGKGKGEKSEKGGIFIRGFASRSLPPFPAILSEKGNNEISE